jgi:hypothetical protein
VARPTRDVLTRTCTIKNQYEQFARRFDTLSRSPSTRTTYLLLPIMIRAVKAIEKACYGFSQRFSRREVYLGSQGR